MLPIFNFLIVRRIYLRRRSFALHSSLIQARCIISYNVDPILTSMLSQLSTLLHCRGSFDKTHEAYGLKTYPSSRTSLPDGFSAWSSIILVKGPVIPVREAELANRTLTHSTQLVRRSLLHHANAYACVHTRLMRPFSETQC